MDVIEAAGRVGLFVCVLVASVAHARATKPVDKAKREFSAGRNAFDAGDYEMAIRRFLVAQSITSSPVLTYNIGLAQERLGHDSDAIKTFERCLEELLAATKMDRRLYTDAKQHLADAKARESRRKPAAIHPAFFEFRGTVGGQIFVDGAARGDVPGRVEVAPGAHNLEVRKPGFVSYQSRLPVSEGESRVVTVELEPEQQRSTIRVESAPRPRVERDPETPPPERSTSTIRVESGSDKR